VFLCCSGRYGADQDFVADPAFKNNMTHCSLTPHLYVAHCYHVFGNIRYIRGNTPVKDLVTFHTSCVSGVTNKKGRMIKVLNAVKQNKTTPMSYLI
jgi:hypothetical protein